MPGPPKIWKEVPDNTTFRITKTIIPWVYYMTFQFKVSFFCSVFLFLKKKRKLKKLWFFNYFSFTVHCIG